MRNSNEQTPQSVIKGPFIKSYTFKGRVFTLGKYAAHMYFFFPPLQEVHAFTIHTNPSPRPLLNCRLLASAELISWAQPLVGASSTSVSFQMETLTSPPAQR